MTSGSSTQEVGESSAVISLSEHGDDPNTSVEHFIGELNPCFLPEKEVGYRYPNEAGGQLSRVSPPACRYWPTGSRHDEGVETKILAVLPGIEPGHQP